MADERPLKAFIFHCILMTANNKKIYSMINFGCQQILIDKRAEVAPILEYLCSESNDLYNCAVYYARQMWFKTGRILSGFDQSWKSEHEL
jgi:hypothetical protein